jgi:anthranilate synthase/aminodeoxychorismate synthase-like glutamine amidotransferase
MAILFMENEDSFSWNVIDALPFARAEIHVRSGRAIGRDVHVLASYSALVIGPGPTDPVRAGIVTAVHQAARLRIPVFGVCLGCQAIGLAFGARLVRTPPAHGRVSKAWFTESRCFPSFRGPHPVMRYHSLSLADVPVSLRVVASTADGLPMAIEHERLPIAGVQFHPDSHGTPEGHQLIADFFRAAT